MVVLPRLGSREVSDDHLVWSRITVDGRAAEYGVGGGEGPPIVFLHGWALGSHAYKRAINRLVARGCQVYAPALPSFGRTKDLPAREMSLDGYADWVASFMATVGIVEPALVIGHSFGGGVSIKLAQRHRDLVSYLVLLNAVGGVARRPVWEWAAGFGRDLWPPWVTFDVLEAARADLLPNLVRNPCGLVKAARLAQHADLRREAEELRDIGMPVLVLTSDGDSVIPRAAFESLCGAIGSNGRVVSGGHSWLLTDPDSFGAVLGPLVDLRVTDHRSTRAATRSEAITELLAGSHLPPRKLRRFLQDAPPLWLMSDDAETLARDLLLCHPALARHEVRAVARPIDDSSMFRLTVVTRDRKGLLADSAAVLGSSDLSIIRASAATWPEAGLALHSFVVEGGSVFDETSWSSLGEKLKVMASTRSLPAFGVVKLVRVTVHGDDLDRSMVTINARDNLGVLARLCRAFSDGGMNIESLHATTRGGMAKDTFIVTGAPDGDSVSRLLAQIETSRPARANPRDPRPAGRPHASSDSPYNPSPTVPFRRA